MGRLPSTYSFGELDKVTSFGPLDDDDVSKEKSQTATPVTTLRASTERRNRSETAAQTYERKVVLAQSVVRRAQAKKRYKQMRSPSSSILYLPLCFAFPFVLICLLNLSIRQTCINCSGDFFDGEDIREASTYLHKGTSPPTSTSPSSHIHFPSSYSCLLPSLRCSCARCDRGQSSQKMASLP